MKENHALDPIVEEVRERGRAATARWGNDLEHIIKELLERDEACPASVVSQPRVVADPDAA
jgi:hypothetical protein